MRVRPVLTLFVLLCTLAGLAACGGEAKNSTGSPGSGTASRPVTVKDSKGEQKLAAAATRVVTLEWAYLEELLLLGVQPVGNADNAGYKSYISAGPSVPDSVKDVGRRQQPNLETIASLRPDLIIATPDRANDILDELKGLAPVLVFEPYRAPEHLTAMREDFVQLATAVGKRPDADRVLGELDKAIADGRKKISDAGQGGTQVAFSQGYSQSGNVTFRVFDGKSIPGQLSDKLGLSRPQVASPQKFGYTEYKIEGLFGLGDVWLLYTANPTDTGLADALRQPAFQALPFVKAGRTRALDPGAWFYGGPASTKKIIDETVKALTS